jgi:hypothetical protein
MRTGVMAPPTLYDQPPLPGLMVPGSRGETPEVSLRSFLWVVALLLGVVELCVESFGP